MVRFITIIALIFSVQLAVASDYYNPTGAPDAGSAGSSSVMRAEFTAIGNGISEKLPGLTGNSDLPVFVNAVGTALESISASSARTKLGSEIGADVQAYDANLPTWPASVSATEVSYLNGVTSAIQTQLNLKAPLASPALTGNPTAPTQSVGNDSTRIATTAFINNEFAPLASPALTGVPTAPTASTGTSTTQLATTAFVQAEASAINPNLIINPNFIVNQEDYDADGIDELTDGEYGHDMWHCSNGSDDFLIYEIESDGDLNIISFRNTLGGANTVFLLQKNDDIILVEGEDITFSFYVESLSNPVTISGPGLTPTAVSTTGWKSFTFTANSDGEMKLYHAFAGSGTYTANFRINSIKLERGSTRTKWQVPEPRAEEDRCYKYSFLLPELNIMAKGSSSLTSALVTLPVAMRTNPTLISGGFVVHDAVGGFAVGTITVSLASGNTWDVTLNHSTLSAVSAMKMASFTGGLLDARY